MTRALLDCYRSGQIPEVAWQEHLRAGVYVTLSDEPGCIVPAGLHRISHVNADGSFHVGGNTAVWPRRIVE